MDIKIVTNIDVKLIHYNELISDGYSESEAKAIVYGKS